MITTVNDVCFKLYNTCMTCVHAGFKELHESLSVHHLPRGSTASGLQSLQDNGPQASACLRRARNCECVAASHYNVSLYIPAAYIHHDTTLCTYTHNLRTCTLQVVGIITRHDLTQEKLLEKIREKKQKRNL